jgi:hypothetical protein
MTLRAQASLPALGIALLLLTATLGLGLALADSAVANAERPASERRLAHGLSEHFVRAESPLTHRSNVLDRRAITNLSREAFTDRHPGLVSSGVRLRVDDRTVFTSGDPRGGTTVRRLVLVQRRQTATMSPGLYGQNASLTLPRRTRSVTLDLAPPRAANVTTVWANDRVVLHNSSGLSGEFSISVSALDTTRLHFRNERSLPPGSVEVTYRPIHETKAILAVTVDE